MALQMLIKNDFLGCFLVANRTPVANLHPERGNKNATSGVLLNSPEKPVGHAWLAVGKSGMGQVH